jgi:peptidyl-prolyl cis-trans isomerase C
MPIKAPLLITALALLALTAAGCQQRPADDGKVLAVVNGESITERDLDHYLQLRRNQREPVTDPEKEKQLALEELIERILLAQHAVAAKLDQEPDVRFTLRHVRESILAQAAIRQALRDQAVTDEELKQRFQRETEETHKTEYRARHILVGSEDEAKAIIKQLEGGASFQTLAKNKSLDQESARRGGELGWINQGMGYIPEFFSALTTLKKGELTRTPVKTDFGWHVILVEDTRPLKLPSFEQFMADPRAQANLRRKMQEERIEALVKELRAKAKITMP